MARYEAINMSANQAAADARQWAEADGMHIDVRGLNPPQPLVAILRLVGVVGEAGVVIVHHDRDPVLLYPELAERGWMAEELDAPAGEVRLRLTALAREP